MTRWQNKSGLIGGLALIGAIACLLLLNFVSRDQIHASRTNYDLNNLLPFFADYVDDDDLTGLVIDGFYLRADGDQEGVVNKQLLGLKQDRLAYVARLNNEVLAVAVPATADDGFNGTIDLLVAVDMLGRITAARVIEDLNGSDLYGVVDVIESQWMKEFTDNTMRDIRRISWQTIDPENEYDQFVGASITPRTVSDKIYDALVFYQSNRINLISGEVGGGL